MLKTGETVEKRQEPETKALMSRLRRATEIELNTSIETIKWSVISTQFRNIEKANLKKHGQSKDRGSMRFPEGIIHCVHHNDNCVEIHSCWRNTLKSMYLIK